MTMLISLEKPELKELVLVHYGVLGMKWGIRKDREKTGRTKTPRISYYDRSKARYLEKGYSEADAKVLAERKSKIRTGAFIAGGVAVAVGTAFLVRYHMIETKDLNMKAGKKAWHIARGEITDLEKGKHLYVTVDQADRFAYRARLHTPDVQERIERTFETVKDIKIPSPKMSEKLYNEFLKDPKNKTLVKKAFDELGIGEPNYTDFVSVGPYLNSIVGKRPIGESAWSGYKNYLVNKGYQGILDANDRARSHGFNVERPAIIFDAAGSLKEVSRKNIGDSSLLKSMIPTIREVGSTSTAAWVAGFAGVGTIGVASNSSALDSYRKVYPNSNKSNNEIIKMFQDEKFAREIFFKVRDM